MGEFDLIERFFHRTAKRSPLGAGDDCALLAPRAGMQLAVSTDMLVEGRHFLSTVDPQRLGHKSLAVNLSDLAACGAQPLAFTLALSMPHVDESWLQGFSTGLLALADEFECELVGGDTTRGPLNICITVFGEVPQGQALLRSGARAGDDLYASGTLGDARLALEVFRGTFALGADAFEAARSRMETPTPRVALGEQLRGIASSAIDISDGLAGDLAHVLMLSRVGASIDADAAMTMLACREPMSDEQRLEFVIAGGDDYELLFSAAPEQRQAVQRAAQQSNTRVTRIGRIDSEPGLRIVDSRGAPLKRNFSSFDHFG
ncbi:MAG TPA: thiamine-phosphate kinase [Ramlibacter sp.]|jgi:thiamine-monophosphate kinase|nr:thiamine-phosphate kinase [Ramlibacter sp.]